MTEREKMIAEAKRIQEMAGEHVMFLARTLGFSPGGVQAYITTMLAFAVSMTKMGDGRSRPDAIDEVAKMAKEILPILEEKQKAAASPAGDQAH